MINFYVVKQWTTSILFSFHKMIHEFIELENNVNCTSWNTMKNSTKLNLLFVQAFLFRPRQYNKLFG